MKIIQVTRPKKSLQKSPKLFGWSGNQTTASTPKLASKKGTCTKARKLLL